MSNKYVIDSDENSDFMYNTIEDIIEKNGPRAPCSEAEKKAAHMVAENLKKCCDSVEIEEFEAYPRAFNGYQRLVTYFILGSFLLFFLSILSPLFSIIISVICLGLTLFVFLIIYKQLLKYEEWTPKVFPYKKGTSQNVVGIIKPTGEVKKRVVYGAHLDSVFKFSFKHYTKTGYIITIAEGIIVLFACLIIYTLQLIYSIFLIDLPILTLIVVWLIILFPITICVGILIFGMSNKDVYEKILPAVLSKISAVGAIFTIVVLIYHIFIDIWLYSLLFIGTEPTLLNVLIVLIFNAIPSFIGLFFWCSKKATDGAVDNLTAVACAMAVGKVLKDYKTDYPNLFPKNTEVIIGIFGCEELGLRGSEEYAKRHAAEYNKIDTTCVNMESISESRFQKIFDRENTTGTDLSPEVYNLLVKCCKELGIEYRLIPCFGLAGGTDAAGLVRGGLKASSLEGIVYKDYLRYYHSGRDNLAMINKERKTDHGTKWNNRNIRLAMENSLRICLKYLEKKDIE